MTHAKCNDKSPWLQLKLSFWKSRRSQQWSCLTVCAQCMMTTWFWRMFCVVKDQHVTGRRLGRYHAWVLWHVPCPVHFTLMVDLYLNLNLARNRSKPSKLCQHQQLSPVLRITINSYISESMVDTPVQSLSTLTDHVKAVHTHTHSLVLFFNWSTLPKILQVWLCSQTSIFGGKWSKFCRVNWTPFL